MNVRLQADLRDPSHRIRLNGDHDPGLFVLAHTVLASPLVMIVITAALTLLLAIPFFEHKGK